MPDHAQLLMRAALIGVGATAVMDIWSAVQKHVLGVKTLDYALVDRWIAYLPRGRFRHESITASPRLPGETAIGWTAHYATGIAFALLLLGIWGIEWTYRPTILPALLVGVGGIVFPFFIVQPGLGYGVAESRAPNPAIARFWSLATHSVFGLGLYVTGWATAGLWAGG